MKILPLFVPEYDGVLNDGWSKEFDCVMEDVQDLRMSLDLREAGQFEGSHSLCEEDDKEEELVTMAVDKTSSTSRCQRK